MRSLAKLWLAFTIAILLYAFLDLGANPWLHAERNFTMQPDLTQIPDLVHWGGRLLKEGAVELLVANAIVIGGLLSLLVRACARFVMRRQRSNGDAERISIVPAHISFPPPPNAG